MAELKNISFSSSCEMTGLASLLRFFRAMTTLYHSTWHCNSSAGRMTVSHGRPITNDNENGWILETPCALWGCSTYLYIHFKDSRSILGLLLPKDHCCLCCCWEPQHHILRAERQSQTGWTRVCGGMEWKLLVFQSSRVDGYRGSVLAERHVCAQTADVLSI